MDLHSACCFYNRKFLLDSLYVGVCLRNRRVCDREDHSIYLENMGMKTVDSVCFFQFLYRYFFSFFS